MAADFSRRSTINRVFQDARGNPKRKASVHTRLGKCFEQIKQFKLAIDNYKASLKHMGDQDKGLRKRANYGIGVLAMDKLNPPDFDTAERCLTELARHDFGYKDASERLDKIAKMRNSS